MDRRVLLCCHVYLVRADGQQLNMCLALECGLPHSAHLRSTWIFFLARVTRDGRHSVAARSKQNNCCESMPYIRCFQTGLASSKAVISSR